MQPGPEPKHFREGTFFDKIKSALNELNKPSTFIGEKSNVALLVISAYQFTQYIYPNSYGFISNGEMNGRTVKVSPEEESYERAMQEQLSTALRLIESHSNYQELRNIKKCSNPVAYSIADMLCVIVAAVIESTDVDPLLWIPGYDSYNSEESKIKEWIRGTSKSVLISTTDLIGGFEACNVIDFNIDERASSSLSVTKQRFYDLALSRCKVSHLQIHCSTSKVLCI